MALLDYYYWLFNSFWVVKISVSLCRWNERDNAESKDTIMILVELAAGFYVHGMTVVFV